MTKTTSARDKFPHRNLTVYHSATAFYLLCWRFAALHRFPDYFLRSQFLRAALSIKLNIAEGAAEILPKEKGRFYRIARRSVGECAAMLDDFPETLGISADELEPMYMALFELSNALRQLMNSMDRKSRATKRKRT